MVNYDDTLWKIIINQIGSIQNYVDDLQRQLITNQVDILIIIIKILFYILSLFSFSSSSSSSFFFFFYDSKLIMLTYSANIKLHFFTELFFQYTLNRYTDSIIWENVISQISPIIQIISQFSELSSWNKVINYKKIKKIIFFFLILIFKKIKNKNKFI